jgi:hypothetical protein
MKGEAFDSPHPRILIFIPPSRLSHGYVITATSLSLARHSLATNHVRLCRNRRDHSSFPTVVPTICSRARAARYAVSGAMCVMVCKSEPCRLRKRPVLTKSSAQRRRTAGLYPRLRSRTPYDVRRTLKLASRHLDGLDPRLRSGTPYDVR